MILRCRNGKVVSTPTGIDNYLDTRGKAKFRTRWNDQLHDWNKEERTIPWKHQLPNRKNYTGQVAAGAGEAFFYHVLGVYEPRLLTKFLLIFTTNAMDHPTLQRGGRELSSHNSGCNG